MVFLSVVNFVKRSGYDRTLKVRKILKLTGVKYYFIMLLSYENLLN